MVPAVNEVGADAYSGLLGFMWALSVPLGSTINSASGVLVLLVLGWGFTYFGQLRSRQAQEVEAQTIPQVAAAD